MDIDGFHHVCRAAASIANSTELTVFGSASVLPYLYEKGIRSMSALMGSATLATHELDVTVGDGKLDTAIDATIGELSSFDETFGYYGHGAGIEVALLPSRWKERARRISYEFLDGSVNITVPHPHDTMVAKLAAGREKDYVFAIALLKVFPASRETLEHLTDEAIEAHTDQREQIETCVRRFLNTHPGALAVTDMPDNGPGL